MKIRIGALAGLLIVWLAFTPFASGQSATATPRAQPTLINGGNRPPFYGEFSIPGHVIRFDSAECGRAIIAALKEGHPDANLPVPTAFCERELGDALAAQKRMPATVPPPATPAPQYTPGPLGP
jgi:hypothetical protein